MNKVGNEVNYLGTIILEKDYRRGSMIRKVGAILFEIVLCSAMLIVILMMCFVGALAIQG